MACMHVSHLSSKDDYSKDVHYFLLRLIYYFLWLLRNTNYCCFKITPFNRGLNEDQINIFFIIITKKTGEISTKILGNFINLF